MLGAVAIRDFALALLIGLLIGAYSSIFVASPLLALLKEREPGWTAIRSKLGGRIGLTPADAARARTMVGLEGVLGEPGKAEAIGFPSGAPRGRKLGKKR